MAPPPDASDRLFPDPEEPLLWYFGYGSNMHRGTFVGRRRMRPRDSRVARLSDWRLAFDLAVGRGERAVANLAPAPGAHTWGVCWRITVPQAAHLDRTEGVNHGAYRRIAIRAETDEGDSFDAFTYHSLRGRAGRKPSARYMGLLVSGATEHGLPDAWIAHLRSFELARDERPREPKDQGDLFANPPRDRRRS